MAFKSLLSFFVVFLLCLQMEMYSAINIEIKPETFTQGSGGGTVEVTCRLDNAEGDAREMMLLKIARKGEKAIVLLHRNNSLTYAAGNKIEFPSKGSVERVVSDTTLTMTLATPDPEDSGMYTCNVYYLNNMGVLKEHRAGSYLTVQDPVLSQLSSDLKNLQDKVDQGQKDIDSLKTKDDDVDDKIRNMEKRTDDRINRIIHDVTTKTVDSTKFKLMESTILHQAETIKDLTEKLAEFDKTIQDLTKEVKQQATKKGDGTLQDIKDDVDDLKESVELLTKSVNDINDKDTKDDVDGLKKKVDQLAKSVSDKNSKDDVDDLKQRVELLTKIVNDINDKDTKDDVDGLKKKVDQLAKSVSDKNSNNDFDNLKERVELLTKTINDIDTKDNIIDNLKEKIDLLTKTVNDIDDKDTKEEIGNLKEKVELLVKNVNDITDTAKENEDTMTKLTRASGVIAKKIDDNEKKVVEVEKKLKTFEDETKKKLKVLSEDDLDNDFLNLQDKVKEHTGLIQNISDKADGAKETADKLRGVTELLAKQVNAQDRKDKPVAFHANTQLEHSDPVENKPLTLDMVTLNEGNGYDGVTGVFTAPLDGIYAFHLLLQVPCHGCKLEVTLQTATQILARFTGGYTTLVDQHSVSAVARLNKYDTIRPMVTFVGNPQRNYEWSLGYLQKSAFSGYLIAKV